MYVVSVPFEFLFHFPLIFSKLKPAYSQAPQPLILGFWHSRLCFFFPTEQLDAAYERALNAGYEEVFLARLNLVGFHVAGKTSLVKRLLGEDFDPGEQSTEGIALHYIKSTFMKDTQRGTSWKKASISADDLHNDVRKNVASHLEPANPDGIADKGDTITQSTDDNQGQEHANAKTTHKEDLHSDDHQNETAPPREEQELQEESMAKREMSELIQPTIVIHEEVQAQETKHVDMSTDTDKNRSQVTNEESTEKQNRGAQYSSEQILASMRDFSKSKESTPFTLRLWDSGGQNDFMTTHHLFLDVGAATLIVMDVTKEFDKPFKIYEKKQNEEKDLRLKRTNPQTPEHILHYWLNSFVVDAAKKNGVDPSNIATKKNDLGLNIAIVLTHTEQIEETKRDKHIQNYKDDILKSLKKKPYKDLFEEIQFFEVDNKCADGNDFEKLREKLFEMFIKQKKTWGYKMPTRWMKLEADIIDTAVSFMDMSTLKTMASENGLGDEDLRSFLDLHNRLGNFLYFSQTQKLAENVITDPKWLVEKCKEVITHPEFIDKRNLRRENEESKIGIQEVEDIL